MTEEIGDKPSPEPNANPEPEKVPEKTFTQDELNDIISKEKARLKASFEAKAQEQAKKDAEAKELERLDGEAKLKKQWEIKERELSERAQKAEHELAVSNVRVMLSEKGYADVSEIAPTLIGSTPEETEQNVSKFDQMVQKLVADKVAKSLNRGTPPDPSAGGEASDKDLQAVRRAMGLM